MMEKDEQTVFQRIPAPLLSWYRQCKRQLAWRDDPTFYHVWVSEIMLQQTRVEAVKAYYARFIQALPTLADLAACDEEKLLKLWEGLGYYNRVRNMQKAARKILLDFNGEPPTDVRLLKTLPGIGEYTAGAIASIAFGQPTAAVDGNVLRVMARLTENATEITSVAYRKQLTQTLSSVYPKDKRDCSDFTQSIFELGALICKPQSPDCEACPLQTLCGARAHSTQALYPVMPQKKARREEDVYVFLIQTPQGFCVRRRESGVLKGMNEFPSCTMEGKSVETVLNEWGIFEYTEIKRRPFTHIFTHIKWNITCVWVQTQAAEFDAYTLEEIAESISLPTAIKQCLAILK